MSAFQVSPNHIGAIVRWYLDACPDHLRAQWRQMRPNRTDAADMMSALAFECWRSVRYRYPSGPLPGPIAYDDTPVVCDERLRVYNRLSPVEVIKACDCLSYQSCEHPEWESSEAYKLLEAIREAAIGQIPGYSEASWEICDGASLEAVR